MRCNLAGFLSRTPRQLTEILQAKEKLAWNYSTKLRITKTDWARLGYLANEAPLEEGRHRGKHSELRHATAAELNEARTDCAPNYYSVRESSLAANRCFQFQKRRQLLIRAHNETPPHPRAVRLQSGSFARWNPRLRHSPKSNRLDEIVSVYFLVLHGEHRSIRRYAGQWIICRMLRCQPSAAIIQTRGRWTTAKYLRP